MFFEKHECDIASYFDANTPHTYNSDLYAALSKLKTVQRVCSHGLRKIT